MRTRLWLGVVGTALVGAGLMAGCTFTLGRQEVAPSPTSTPLVTSTPGPLVLSSGTTARASIVDAGATATEAAGQTATASPLASMPTPTQKPPQPPQPTKTAVLHESWMARWSEEIREYAFAGTQNAWIVLNGGTLLHTTDRGRHWEKQYDRQVAHVAFADKDHGWIVAHDSILGTEDGGQSWHLQFDLAKAPTPTGNGPPYYVTKAGGVSGISFVSAQHGWASTSVGLLTTVDGGRKWERVDSNQWIVVVRFTDDSNGWGYAGGGAEDPKLSHTTDGGQTWLTWQYSGPGCNWYKAGGLFTFAGPDTAWAICFPTAGTSYADPLTMTKSTDGGQSWPAVLSTELDKGVVPRELVGQASVEGLFFLNDKMGWVAAVAPAFVPDRSSSEHILRKTQDGGRSWETIARLSVGLSQLRFATPLVGYGVDGGTLLGTTDGGEHWESIYSP